MQPTGLSFAAAAVAAALSCGFAAAPGSAVAQPVQELRLLPQAIQVQVAQRKRVRPAPAVRRGDISGSIILQEDRELRRKLDGIQRTIDEGQAAEGARYLGTLLQDPATRDFFISASEDERSRRSFKAELRRMIDTLPAEGLQAYELQFGSAARKMLETGIVQGDAQVLEEVASRYYHTAASAEALFLLAQMHLDRGQAREAASCLQRLQDMTPLAAPFEPQLGLMIASCWVRAGETAQARESLAQLKSRHPQATFATAASALPQSLFDDSEQALQWLDRLIPATANSRRSEADWLVHLGAPSRQAAVPASQPFAVARWALPISSEPDVLDTIHREYRVLRSQGDCPLPLVQPVAIGELLLLTTYDGVQAIDVRSGKPRWPVDDDRQFTNSRIARGIWRDAAFSSLATDGRAIYLVTGNDDVPDDSQGSNPQQAVFWRGPFGGGEMGGPGAVSNRLSALSIEGQGKLLWTVSGDSPEHPQLAAATFLGNPLPYGGQLFVLAEVSNAIRLYCLDAATGAVQWWQELAVVEHSIAVDVFRRMAGASPSIADGVVVCPTAAGGVVAVDLASRSLLWAYQYPRQPNTFNAPNRGRVATLRQGERWLDSSAVIAQGHVLTTPPESDEIHCLDLFTGELVWSQKRQAALYLAGVHRDQVVLVEPQHVTALRLETGEPAWKRSLPARVAGRGVLTADGRYHLPLSNSSIQQIDLVDGQLGTPMLSLRGLPLGNLVWHEGTFISVGQEYIEAYDDQRHLQQEIARRAAQAPQSPGLLFDQGRVAVAEGKLPEAIAHFKAAYQADRNPRYKSAFLSVLQDAVRTNLPGREQWQAELDRLLGF